MTEEDFQMILAKLESLDQVVYDLTERVARLEEDK